MWSEELVERIPSSDKQIRLYCSGRHSLDDGCKIECLEDVAQWIDAHLEIPGVRLNASHAINVPARTLRPTSRRKRLVQMIKRATRSPRHRADVLGATETVRPETRADWHERGDRWPSAGPGLAACDFVVNDEYRDTLPPVSDWPDAPVLVRCSPDVPMEIYLAGKSAYGALPINDKSTPIPFETPLFKGHAMIRIADLPSSPADYFRGKRRKMQVAIQGKFKRPLRFDQVFSGQEFAKPLRNIPGRREKLCSCVGYLTHKGLAIASHDRWLIKWALSLLRSRLPDTFQADAFAEKPYFLSPLISTSQSVRADRDIPQDITSNVIDEENKEFGGPFTEKKFNGEQRRKFFGDIQTLQQYTFDPDVTYTFDYYQQFFRAGLFALDVGVKLLDLAHYVGKQPLLLTMAKTMDTDEYLWKFELWHEKVLGQVNGDS